jgi:MarR family multiple antibiotic resistance transcriptional regulator
MKHFSPDNFHSSAMGLLIGRTNGLKDRLLEKYLESYDVTAAQFKVLIIVAQFGTNTPAELCRHLSLDSGSMTRMLDRLEQKQLLIRNRSAADRRQVHLVLTPEGQRLADLMPQIGANAMNDLFSDLNAGEVATLKQILLKVLVAAGDQITLERLDLIATGEK